MRAAAARPLPTAAAQHGAGECTRVCLSRVLQVALASSEWERRSREGGGRRVGTGVATATVESEGLSRPVCRAACGAGARAATSLVVASEVGLWASWFLSL